MSVLDQIIKPADPAPLEGKLGEIDAVLARFQDAGGNLDEAAALAEIRRIVSPSPSCEIYQKPLG